MLTSSVITLFLIGTAQSFTGSWVSNKKGFDVSLASTSEAGNVKKPLTAADILSRARKSVGVSTEEDADSSPATLLFDDHLLQDIQKTLVTLEKRVKNGPRSLSVEEIKALEAACGRILEDLKTYKESPKNTVSTEPPRTFLDTTNPSVSKTSSTISTPENRDIDDIFSPFAVLPQFQKQSPYQQPLQGEAQAVVDSFIQKPSTITDDDNESEDGAKYSGRGGFGMAAGTRNTYFIPGMDEMSPEEYRDALQKSVSDRQSMRKRRGTVGNMSSQSYLDQLTKPNSE